MQYLIHGILGVVAGLLLSHITLLGFYVVPLDHFKAIIVSIRRGMHCKLHTVFYAAQQHCTPTLWPSNKHRTCAISITGYESIFLGNQQA